MFIAGAVFGQQLVVANAAASSSRPVPFTSHFIQPNPPIVNPEFKANWNQHKWSDATQV